MLNFVLITILKICGVAVVIALTALIIVLIIIGIREMLDG